MSLEEIKPTSPNASMFVRDQNGRTLFYVSGSRFGGYVVPDSQREYALRNAIERFKKMEASFGYFVIPIISVCIVSLGGQYSSFALTVLTVTLMVAAIGRGLQRRWCYGDLVADLDRVEPLDMAGRRLGIAFFSLIAIAYCSYVVWRILQAIQSNSL